MLTTKSNMEQNKMDLGLGTHMTPPCPEQRIHFGSCDQGRLHGGSGLELRLEREAEIPTQGREAADRRAGAKVGGQPPPANPGRFFCPGNMAREGVVGLGKTPEKELAASPDPGRRLLGKQVLLFLFPPGGCLRGGG